MSRKRKFKGRKKLPWIGKTPASQAAEIERTLLRAARSSPHRPIWRETDWSTVYRTRPSNFSRQAKKRADRGLLDAYPVGSFVTLHTEPLRFGVVLRIRHGKYVLRMHDTLETESWWPEQIKHRLVNDAGW